MIFEKPDEVIFNKDDLTEAILNHTDTPKDKYRIMLKVYDGDTYIYHVSLKAPPQKMAVYRVDKK